MRRFLLLLLVLPLLAGACGDDATEDTPDPADTTEGAKPIVRLERAGDKFTASYSLDGGATFGAEKSVSISGLPDKLLIGLAANSGDSKKTSEAVFSDVKINGQTVAFE